ncbi:tetratricopeptide repeat protein [Kordiimonas pumila]|uniref:Tetratricopeptide repeat protein n=1 Tax=Kordiimonas pumila TaxID=2161677 RepID=A0ABV7D238_9PROT|nr:tetratricopeptide repeat protein [Kordiimonas pumila]
MICFKRYLAKVSKASVLAIAFAISPSVYAQVGQQAVVVQAAQLSGYARLGFGVPATTVYRIALTGTKLRIYFQGNLSPNMMAVENADLRQVGNPVITRNLNETIITFDVLPNVSPRDFRSGEFLIIDIYGGDAGSTLPKPQPLLPSSAANGPAKTGGDDTSGNSSADDENKNDAEEGSADQGTQAEEEAGVEPQSLNSENDPEPIKETPKAPEKEQALPPSAPSAAVTDIEAPEPRPKGSVVVAGTEQAATDAQVVPVSVAENDNGISLSFDWPEATAAAVFERGGVLWVVFDQIGKLDKEGIYQADNLVTGRINRIEQRPNADAFVLRMFIRSNQNAVVERDQNKWVLYLKDTPAKPRFPLKPERRSEGQGQQIYVSATDIGRKIEVEDPDVGDTIIVLPLARQGNGLAESYSYAAAELLETAQGVAITPLTDFVEVERFRDGIIVRSTGNDILSASRLSRATGIGDNIQAGFSRLIDFENWRIGEPWEYRKNKARLLYELSLQPKKERNGVRWKLARYYLAHGRAAECIGVLNVMLLEDPLLAKNTEYLAVRGVANFKQGRLTEAMSDLSARELEAEQDAELWRTLVAEALGQYEQSLEHYRRGRDVMGTYDEYDRAEIQLAVIRAAIETGNLELAQQELGLLNGLELTGAQLAESVYQSARISEKQGQYETAYAQYDDLSGSRERWISARARYSRIKFSLKNGDIDVGVAIDQLERLRYAWRGDRFESQLLDDLANLYVNAGKYEEALETLRQGISYYPEVARQKRMLLRMGDIFRYLFLDNGADEMTPVAAIGLFYKFRDLTPLGTEGDLMIRRLAERLVSVDLLGRAAELLEYQVKARTEGAARAQIAANLAKIYLLDERPNDALEILRATREPRLPDDIAQNRQHVETRALIELEKYEEAEVLIEQDRGTEADILRADIYWGAKDWSRLVPTIRRLLGDGWRRNETITALQRLNLIRLAIAMTFTEDRAGLIEMRRRYGNQMRSGDFTNAFELLTNDQDLTRGEIGSIASQIASVEKLQSFMRDYRSDFSGR